MDNIFEENGTEAGTPVVPINSESMISSNDYMARFSGADWFSETENITVAIIGLGGIGSHAALSVAKLGCNVILNDFDTVEIVNMSGQNYHTLDIGMTKVAATKNMLMSYGIPEERITCIERNIDNYENMPMADIYILALDSIDTRKRMCDMIHLKRLHDDSPVDIIDGRLSAELIQIFHCNVRAENSFERYKGSFFDKKDAMPTMCSFKQTFYMASMMGNFISNMIVNIMINRISQFYVPVPFFIEYNSRLMDYKLEL